MTTADAAQRADGGEQPEHVRAVLDTMRSAGAAEVELAAMRRRLDQLEHPEAGLLPGDRLEPLGDLPGLDDLPEPPPAQAREVLDRTVVLTLNGGLGTSMGMEGPKSLLEVKPGRTFLDVVAMQVLALRERHGTRLPLLMMHSATTRQPSLEVLSRWDGLADQPVPLDFLQGREPKLRADDLHPVRWPADPDLEWCPPGHGDLYTSLSASGLLQQLLDCGIRWAFVSNSDNLGAVPDVRVAAWMAREELPFVMEAVEVTAADKKGGHLARLDGQVVLREVAQVPEGDASFGDVGRWRWHNTNNLWLDLQALADLQAADPSAPALPLIVNRKTVDPKDPASTPVLQLETAMGAAVGSLPGARALHVPRTRFAPVKTTSDLCVVRSDAYALHDDGRVLPAFDGHAPHVVLDDGAKLVRDYERRFPHGEPSLRGADRFEVDGDVVFGRGVVVEGDVVVRGSGRVQDGAVLRGEVVVRST